MDPSTETTERAKRLVLGIGCTENVYIVSYDEVRHLEEHLAVSGAHAWTCHRLDLMLKDYLQSIGQWAGRGFATVVNYPSIPHSLAFYGIVLHEFAHYVEDLLTPDDPELNGHEAVFYRAIFAISMEHNIERARHIPNPPWHNHDKTFIRACCHIAKRATKELESLHPSHLLFRDYYRASENTWMRTLESELESELPLTELLKTEPPKEFTELHQLLTSWFDHPSGGDDAE